MLANCENCKIIFEAPIFKGIPGLQINIDSINVLCPNCKQPAKVFPGTYTFDSTGLLKFLNGNHFSVEALRQLEILLQKAKTENLSVEDIKERAGEIDSNFTLLINKYAPKNFSDLVAFLSLLISIIGLLVSNSGNTTIIDNRTIINNESAKQPVVDSLSGMNKNIQRGSNYTAPKKKRKRRK